MLGGTYPAQEIDLDAHKSGSSTVTVQPAPGASVTIGTSLYLGDAAQQHSGPQHLRIQNLTVAGAVRIGAGSTDVELDNVNGKVFGIAGSQNVRIVGGNWGPCSTPADGSCNSKIDMLSPGDPGVPTSNIVIDGITIHDIISTNHGLYHTECLFLRAGTNVTIRNSKFYNCDIYDIFVQTGGPAITNVTIENNYFASPSPSGSECVAWGQANVTWSGWLVRFNTCT
jgi:hypothetical protein